MTLKAMPAGQEIVQHPYKEDARIYCLGVQRDASADVGDEPIVVFTGTDGSEDRHGSVINPRGWEMDHFKANPVVQWAHDPNIPAVGNAPNFSFMGSRWNFPVRFAVEAWDVPNQPNLARLLYNLCARDFIRAMSVGFIPKEWKDREATTIPSFFSENVEYLRQEMTEVSIVNVGSNRNGLKKALAENVITENEISAFGFLDKMFRIAPVILRSAPPEVKPDTTKARCCDSSPCGCAPAPEPAPVSAETQNTEVGVMNALADVSLDQIAVGLDGWERAEHDELRGICEYAVSGGMWRYDQLRRYLKDWYGVPLAKEPTVDQERAIALMLSRELAERAGAVLNKANKARLEQIKSLADEVLASAEKVPTEEESEVQTSAPEFSAEQLRDATTNIFGSTGDGRLHVKSHDETAKGAAGTTGDDALPTPTGHLSALFSL